jgi:hypothetical protein
LADRRARGIGAFSGGLDGIVAARLLDEIGVEVALATFFSPFFGSDRGREGALALGLPWRELDFTEDILALLSDPPSGFGRRMNPCIDCHAAMLARLGVIMLDEGFDFVFSGEVLGQRPMSQNPQSLNRVARLSGLSGRLLRPLSARLLKPTDVEAAGLVDRERLLAISGRGRREQMAFARARDLPFPAPGGGCLLTDPGYSLRLRLLSEMGLVGAANAMLIGTGRMVRLGPGAAGIIGRNRHENDRIEEMAGQGVFRLCEDLPGPSAVLMGDPGSAELLASLVAFYGRIPPGAEARVESPSGILSVVAATASDAAGAIVSVEGDAAGPE